MRLSGSASSRDANARIRKRASQLVEAPPITRLRLERTAEQPSPEGEGIGGAEGLRDRPGPAAILAHQGGWDEALFVVVPLALFAWILSVAKRRAEREAIDETRPGPGPDVRSRAAQRGQHVEGCLEGGEVRAHLRAGDRGAAARPDARGQRQIDLSL